MDKPKNFSKDSELLLDANDFKQTSGGYHGMWGTFQWANSKFKITLKFDRGSYNCNFTLQRKPNLDYGIIDLIRFIKNDPSFQEEELKQADDCINFVFDHYNELERYDDDFKEEDLHRFKNFMKAM